MYDASMNTKWQAVKRGDGSVVGYLELFNAGNGWVSIPGASRFVDAIHMQKCDHSDISKDGICRKCATDRRHM